MPGPDPADSATEILRYVALWDDPFVTAKDVEPKLRVGRKQTYNRLQRLRRDGLLCARTVGPNATLFWLSERGRTRLRRAEFDAGDD